MGSTTEIAWTDSTWSPVVGCTPASAGCANCYAREMHDRRRKAKLAGKRLPAQYAKPFSTIQCFPERLSVPLHWKKPRRVFVCSTADLFHPDVPYEFIAAVFGVMAVCPQHTFQVLTKRPERMRDWFEWGGENSGLRASRGWRRWSMSACDYGTEHDVPLRWQKQAPADWPWPLPNVWLGVTVENQAAADERVPLLLQTPAALRFLSCEPLIGEVDLGRWIGTFDCRGGPGCSWRGWRQDDGTRCPRCEGHDAGPVGSRETEPDLHLLDWVIVGGESGQRARPMDLDWARSLVDQCREAGVPCFVKQLGRRPFDTEIGGHLQVVGAAGILDRFRSLDGRDPAEWPEDLRVQEWPEVERG